MQRPRGGGPPATRRTDTELPALLTSAARLAAAVSRSTRRAPAPLGLSGAQLVVLGLLAEAPAGSMTDLAARTGTHQSTVSAVVSSLVRRGLVARSTDAADGRRVRLALTPAGRALARRAPSRSPLAEALRRLPRRERRALARALSRLVDELSEELPAGGARKGAPLRPRIARRDG